MLRRHRHASRLTQEALAERAGLSARSLREMERGRTPRPRTVEHVATALGLTGVDREEFVQAAATLYWTGRSAPAARSTTDVPRQLPADLPDFVGREDELAAMDETLQTNRVAVISGPPGVGKTTLTVHWAHRVAHRFPDGQLYLNLRGFDAAGRAVDPGQAVRGFLAALGVPPQRIPPDLDAQAGLYRSSLAGRRVLIVLDNVRDADQVRVVLPGTATCVVLITSRNQLTSLVATDGASPLRLDVLSSAESWQLLAHRVGRDRVVAEPAAVQQIMTACARLPLALSIAAARARHTTFPLATLASELNSADGLLEALDAGDITTQVRAVFSWSYTILRPPVARMFRLLGLHAGPDISTAAAASLAGDPLAEARRLLTELTRANLVVEHLPGRYAVHDLLRAYAAEVAHVHDPEHHREAAMIRLLDHYAHTGRTATGLLDPRLDPSPVPLAPPAPGTCPEPLIDRENALAWLTAEHTVLLATVQQAATAGYHQYVYQLAWALRLFLDRTGRWHELLTVASGVRGAGQQMDGPIVEAFGLRMSARAEARLGRFARARNDLERALDLYTRAGYHTGVGHTYSDLNQTTQHQGDYAQAVEYAALSLAVFQRLGNQPGMAAALNGLGYASAMAGEPGAALECCKQALAMFQQLDDPWAQALTWHSLGYAHHRAGHHIDAVHCYQQALGQLRAYDDRYNPATVLTHLGDAYDAAGDAAAANEAWRTALTMLTQLRHPDADAVRAKLHEDNRQDGRDSSAGAGLVS